MYAIRSYYVMACHCGYHALQLNNGIYRSCNSYFGNTYKRIIEKYPNSFESVDTWANHVKSFGLGQFLGTDMPIGAKGLVPDSKLYKKVVITSYSIHYTKLYDL